MGCNHMKCYQCNTHFCYLCGSWLSPDNPYPHYSKAGPCHNKLWDMEGGDNGEGNAFAGARHYEQLAREVAREADEEDARALQLEEDARAGEILNEEEDLVAGFGLVNVEPGFLDRARNGPVGEIV
jgi:E3 ubiquitin-protein ligase RNF14